MPPRTLAIVNQKGGVGKTTTAVSLAACLAALGRHVLLVDCDPQSAASRWLGRSKQPGDPVLALHFRRQPPAAYDYVILDAPPELGMLSINALVAAAELLIPVSPDPLATQVLDQLLDTIDRVRERLNPALRIAGILPVRVRPRTLLARQALANLAARFPDLLLPVHIRDTVRAAEAPARQLPLLDHRPGSSAAQDYRALASLVIEQEVRA